jgi:uncharacterized membrane-anchored protein YitT (DUF2179 family)
MAKETYILKPVDKMMRAITLLLGSAIGAVAIRCILVPNQLIDGGMVGIALLLTHWLGQALFPLLLILLNVPLLIWGGRQLGRAFVISGMAAVAAMALGCHLLAEMPQFWLNNLRDLEAIVLGGSVLGLGIGMVIRSGGCTDGTEAVALLLQRKTGFTVGQIILVTNLAIFGCSCWITETWRTGFYSLLVYLVAAKVMDRVIVGLNETKSCTVISRKFKPIADRLIAELGVGLTYFYGRGGFSGDEREIIYVVVERLHLPRLKQLVQEIDPGAFIAVENLHEVINARVRAIVTRRLRRKLGWSFAHSPAYNEQHGEQPAAPLSSTP